MKTFYIDNEISVPEYLNSFSFERLKKGNNAIK